MQKIRIGVLMGGKSQECEVSFNSGRTICDHLDTNLYEVVPLFQTIKGILYILPWSFLHRGKITDFEKRLDTQAQRISWDDLKNSIDFIYIAMHGQFAEDGTIQGMLEILQIPYFGSKVYASALGIDKSMQKKFLAMHDISVPHGVEVNAADIHDIKTILKKINTLSWPLIVKPSCEGSSLGVSVITHEEQLLAALKKAIKESSRPQSIIIEEKITGMEFSCIVMTDNNTGEFVALPPTEIVTPKDIAFFDYEQKYMPGKSLQYTPARCTSQAQTLIQDTCIQVMKALEFSNIGRIDGFLTAEGLVVIIDPNSFSGAAPSSFLFKQAAYVGLNHAQFINHIIKTELQAYGMGSSMAQKSELSAAVKKMRVGVIMGGISDEKEISLESGRNITYKISPVQYESIPLFLNKDRELYKLDARLLVASSTQEIESQLQPSMKVLWQDLPSLVDFVFIGLHGGIGENGTLQGALEMLGIPYNGSGIFASALCIDKFKTNRFLEAQGFAVPQGMLVAKDAWLNNKNSLIATIEKTITFPCVIKPRDNGCSVGVQIVKDKKSCSDALDSFFKQNNNALLIEEYVKGMELTVGVIGNEKPKALPPSQAITRNAILSIEEKFLPGAGENQTPAPLAPEALALVKSEMESVFKVIGCKGYVRIDCFYQPAAQSPTQKDRVVILEVNTLPGLTPATCIFHQAAEIGLRPMEFIDCIIQLGIENHRSHPKTDDIYVEPQEAPRNEISF
ncbi:MAG: ATP-grasp domain-containing protein [Candidatus Babeliales bacterium]